MTTRRFKFLSARVQKVLVRQRRFRPTSRVKASDRPNVVAAWNQTQRQLLSLLQPQGWVEVSRHEIHDTRTGRPVTEGGFEQALQRLTAQGVIEVLGAGDVRRVRLTPAG